MTCRRNLRTLNFVSACAGRSHCWSLAVLSLLIVLGGKCGAEGATAPRLLHYQGRVLADGRVFDGTGLFKFALVSADGATTWWRSAADADADGQPDAAVSLPVARGLYSLLLGDTRLANMAALPPSALEQDAVHLRVWFSDGAGPFELFAPDQQLASTAYALLARTVEDGAITTAKFAPGALTPAQIPPLDAGQITSGRLETARLPEGVAFREADVAPLAVENASLRAALLELSTRVAALEAGGVQASRNPSDAGLESAGYARFASIAAPGWRNGTAANALSARRGHSAVWTGVDFIIWGGLVGDFVGDGDEDRYSDVGAAYRPAENRWAPLPGFQSTVPEPRADHTAVWTGTEMIVWGGGRQSLRFSSGGRYAPTTQDWLGMTTNHAPSAREGHIAAWCAGRMLVWGGRDNSGLLGDGALYDPAADQWTPLALSGGPSPRHFPSATVAGNSVFIWGGEGAEGPLSTGAELVLHAEGTAAEWRPINVSGAPRGRLQHTAVWTGHRLLVWGGMDVEGEKLGDGAAYDPTTGQWSALPATGAPSARAGHTAVWTGVEMLVVAGEGTAGPLAAGGAYDPSSGTWRALGIEGDPLPRSAVAAAWTGTEVLVFGGVGDDGVLVASLERLDPAGAWHLFRKP